MRSPLVSLASKITFESQGIAVPLRAFRLEYDLMGISAYKSDRVGLIPCPPWDQFHYSMEFINNWVSAHLLHPLEHILSNSESSMLKHKQNARNAPITPELTSWKSIGSALVAKEGLIIAATTPSLGSLCESVEWRASSKSLQDWINQHTAYVDAFEKSKSPGRIIRIMSLYRAIDTWQCVPQRSGIKQNLRRRIPIHWKKKGKNV